MSRHVASDYQLHYAVRAPTVERDNILINFLNHLVDEPLIILYRAPPKSKHLLCCQSGPPNPLQRDVQTLRSYLGHGIPPIAKLSYSRVPAVATARLSFGDGTTF